MKVKLIYFKSSGKYYSESEFYYSNRLHFFQVFREVRQMLREGKRPGLVDCPRGQNEFTVLVWIEGGPPALVHPEDCRVEGKIFGPEDQTHVLETE